MGEGETVIGDLARGLNTIQANSILPWGIYKAESVTLSFEATKVSNKLLIVGQILGDFL